MSPSLRTPKGRTGAGADVAAGRDAAVPAKRSANVRPRTVTRSDED